MAMIPPTLYRSMLRDDLKDAYRQVTASLLDLKKNVILSKAIPLADAAGVIEAVHLDHPELFYVDFWRANAVRMAAFPGRCIGFQFTFLIEENLIPAPRNTLERSIRETVEALADVPAGRLYRRIAERIAASVTYRTDDNSNAFMFHTVMGALLKHQSVCEGISKLFLIYCQHMGLPCAVVSGTCGGAAHDWNMIEVRGRIRYLDVTSMVCSSPLAPMAAVTYTAPMLKAAGYRWDEERFTRYFTGETGGLTGAEPAQAPDA